jgi:hypothetical protein
MSVASCCAPGRLSVAATSCLPARTACRSGDGRALVTEAGVTEVHDLHVREITPGFPALSAHILVGTEINCRAAHRHLESRLHDQCDIEHTILQVDHEGGELLDIELPEQHERSTR